MQKALRDFHPYECDVVSGMFEIVTLASRDVAEAQTLATIVQILHEENVAVNWHESSLSGRYVVILSAEYGVIKRIQQVPTVLYVRKVGFPGRR